MGAENYPAFIDRCARFGATENRRHPEVVADPMVWRLERAEPVTGETILVDSGAQPGTDPARPAPIARRSRKKQGGNHA